MKSYKLNLKGTKKNNTTDVVINVYGENKSQAFNWAYNFFQKGEFVEPYFAKGLNRMCGGTVEFIPESKNIMDLRGKYFVPRSSVVLNN